MKPVLLDVPEEVQTDRLILRAPRFGDGIVVNEAILESFDALRQWLSWAVTIPSVEETEENVRRNRSKFLLREDFMFYLILRETGAYLGTCTLKAVRWEFRLFEIGYWLRTSALGKGYMTEAVEGLTKFAEQYLAANRIEILCEDTNMASRRVAERCGYQLEGVLRQHYINPQGEIRNDCMYARIF